MTKSNLVKFIEAQKACANAVLNMLHMVDPDSCILGGAPRDWALNNIAKEIPEKAKILAEKFWPGSITLVLKKKDTIPNSISNKLYIRRIGLLEE